MDKLNIHAESCEWEFQKADVSFPERGYGNDWRDYGWSSSGDWQGCFDIEDQHTRGERARGALSVYMTGQEEGWVDGERPITAALRPVKADSIWCDGTPGGWNSEKLYIASNIWTYSSSCGKRIWARWRWSTSILKLQDWYRLIISPLILPLEGQAMKVST